jgi:pimeloyl-ACP methyl ester carboxylesterase
MKNSRSQGANGINGTELRHTDSGSGNAVLLLQTAQKSALADRLAQDFRLVTLDLHDCKPERNLAEAIGRTARQLGIAKYCLIAESELAELAIAHATGSGDSVEALVLLAPAYPSNDNSDDLRLEEIRAPTLVLFGTRDQVVPPETGRNYARRIPKCFYTLVYDAGHDIGIDRPQSLYAVVRDFLEHREKFIIPHGSSAINP